MRTAVEISLYPLAANYVPPIKDFIVFVMKVLGGVPTSDEG